MQTFIHVIIITSVYCYVRENKLRNLPWEIET